MFENMKMRILLIIDNNLELKIIIKKMQIHTISFSDYIRLTLRILDSHWFVVKWKPLHRSKRVRSAVYVAENNKGLSSHF